MRSTKRDSYEAFLATFEPQKSWIDLVDTAEFYTDLKSDIFDKPMSARQQIKQMVRKTQEDNRDVIATMPSVARTAGQRELKKKHGTPRAFAKACVNAIGEISPLEALTAIRKYRDEWEKA